MPQPRSEQQRIRARASRDVLMPGLNGQPLAHFKDFDLVACRQTSAAVRSATAWRRLLSKYGPTSAWTTPLRRKAQCHRYSTDLRIEISPMGE
jgi:hypothetical protein